MISPALSKRLGQAIVVENRPGAAGSVGAGELVRAKPDEYEAEQYAPIVLEERMTQAQLDALDNWKSSDYVDAQARAVLTYTDAMIRDVHVPK